MVKKAVSSLGLVFVVILCIHFGGGEASGNTFLINCGTNGSATIDGRIWIGDMEPNNNVTFSSGVVVTNSSYNGDSAFSLLYTTARIFTDSMNYTFIGAQGNCILRLHFYPISFQNFDINKSLFSVKANGVKLLSKFNVPGEITLSKSYLQGSDNSSSPILINEYFLNNDIETLVIHFVPDEGLFGYVNAIEIVPVVDALFVETVTKVGSGSSSSSLDLRKRGIQTMYRLNVGSSEIKPDEDALWRNWKVDTGYMLTSNAGFEIKNKSQVSYASDNDTIVAPLSVYETARTTSNADVLEKRFNMSWKFVVDPGFDYLVRLHFCELEFDQPSQRNFRIYINNRTAADNFDIVARAHGKNKAYHQDYLDFVPSNIDTIWIQLGPDIALGPSESDALLNGLEIFKLSQNGNLAHIEDYPSLGPKRRTKNLILWVGAGAGFLILVSLIMLILCLRKRRINKNKPSDIKTWRPLFLNGSVLNSMSNAKGTIRNSNPGSIATGGSSRHFTLTEIKSATNNFDESLILGVGGFGKVYKGELEEGITVAIKRANPQSEQGLKEFQTEVEMLSRLRHRHLVSMIGFCEEHNEMILVYEYMANGTLRGHLFGTNDITPLTWKQRLEICIGSARGLHYLHTGSERGIIHRDVKTTNILLDGNFVAKMADFGLSKTGPSLEHTHVSTAVKGSFGYLDPEYFRRQQLTEKSDVYSFGVVLFETVCARPVINPSLPKDQINLAEWAMRWQRQRSLETIMDPHLKGKLSSESLEKFGEIAEKCLGDEGKSRPTMGEVLWHLEYLLQIHEAWIHDNGGEEGDSIASIRAGCSKVEDEVVESG